MKKTVLSLILSAYIFFSLNAAESIVSKSDFNKLPTEIICYILAASVDKSSSLKNAIESFNRLSLISINLSDLVKARYTQKLFLHSCLKKFNKRSFQNLFDDSIIKSGVKSEKNTKLIKLLLKLNSFKDNKLIKVNVQTDKLYKKAYKDLENILCEFNLETFGHSHSKFIHNLSIDVSLLHIAAIGNYLEIVKVLLDKGADVNAKNCKGFTPLICAIIAEDDEIVRILLDKGANNLNLQNGNERLIFRHAILNNSLKIVKVLLSNNLDNINAQDTDGETELMFSVRNNRTKIVKELLKNGADPNIRDHNRWTALIVAANKGYTKIVKVLLKANNISININTQDFYGETALDKAIIKKHVNIVKMLLDKGANPEIRNNRGRTALIKSVFCDDIAILKLLLNRGVNVDSRDSSGDTALMCAVRQLDTEMVKMLLDNSADVNIQNNSGDTAIMFGSFEISKMLIAKGADPEILNFSMCILT